MEKIFTHSIFVLESEKKPRKALINFLLSKGFAVSLGKTEDDSIKTLPLDPPSIILTDTYCLEKTKSEILNLLQSTSGYDDVRCILIATKGEEEKIKSYLGNLVADFIYEPYTELELETRINYHLKARSMYLQLERDKKDLSAIIDISKTISSTLDLDDVLFLTVKKISEIIAVARCSIALVESGSDKLVVIASQEDPSIKNLVLSLGKYPEIKRAIETKSVVIINNIREDPIMEGVREKLNALNFHSIMVLPITIKEEIMGTLVLRAASPTTSFSKNDVRLCQVVANTSASIIKNVQLYQNLENTFKETVISFAHALEARDKYTHGHSEEVTRYAKLIAIEMELPEKDINLIYQAGILHDIGKIGMKEETLNKPGRLTTKERKDFQMHPVWAKHILSPIKSFSEIIPIIYYHHEWFDGSGYPEGLKGSEIPIGARIIAVADTYHAMVSDRSYRKRRSMEAAIEEIKRYSGIQFDPEVVNAFINVTPAY
ncbi:MAG: HD domain-containing protein [Nitrospirae bacterium]|nr:HD domain-containing protein [Nitrospirota bacterium]